jgi:hypothetical protein
MTLGRQDPFCTKGHQNGSTRRGNATYSAMITPVNTVATAPLAVDLMSYASDRVVGEGDTVRVARRRAGRQS